ncbi:MAG TPA: hypothetical protein VHB25_20005, partial [Gemmatimonadaceae bacterium]|nr:hypothetical protein [Gemmatimonadaceae bacterium]
MHTRTTISLTLLGAAIVACANPDAQSKPAPPKPADSTGAPLPDSVRNAPTPSRTGSTATATA